MLPHYPEDVGDNAADVGTGPVSDSRAPRQRPAVPVVNALGGPGGVDVGEGRPKNNTVSGRAGENQIGN